MRLVIILGLFLYSCAAPSGADDFDDVEPQGEASALTDVEFRYFTAETLTGLAEARCDSGQLAVGGSCDCFAGDDTKNGLIGYCRIDSTKNPLASWLLQFLPRTDPCICEGNGYLQTEPQGYLCHARQRRSRP